MGIDLDLEKIGHIAERLDASADTLNGTAAAPAAVDAGEMSAIINSLLAAVSSSSAVIVDDLGVLAANARTTAADFRATDDVVSLDFHRLGPSSPRAV